MNGFITSFEGNVSKLTDKYNIDPVHAGCYISNHYDEFICSQYNGGCSHQEACKLISEKEREI